MVKIVIAYNYCEVFFFNYMHFVKNLKTDNLKKKLVTAVDEKYIFV